ncbi:E3 ubiquitin-protein ligase MARCH5 [Choanephora cucurbitarum]|uniref:E3 ubiquitin-protein ligase MARCH5 n=1 Tax=Choanephora cucurbitarum TaxID=101091 RepID=A0A1C7NB80_9FUNG|nr:E3 ubiquitin-protein ligase MARCH5 [Choanephora cucurbitarum]
MSYFRYPGSSSFVDEASLYIYRPIRGLDDSQLSFEEEDKMDNFTKLRESTDNKRCWICFGEDADSEGKWVFPCRCSLVSHEQCLLDWIAENQKNTPLKKVACPQCATKYVLTERQSIPLALMSIADNLVRIAAPYLTVLGLGCSMLITSSTLGAHVILTVFGAKDGEQLIGNPALWTWKTWLGLPSIPVALIASRSKWADHVLPATTLFLLKMTTIPHPLKLTWPPSPTVVFGLLPWMRLLYNNIYLVFQRKLLNQLIRSQQRERSDHNNALEEVEITEGADSDREANQDADILFNREGRNMSVIVIGALLWPTIGSIMGRYLSHSKLIRQYFPEQFQRTVLGGCLFVVAKDMANLYYRYERIRRKRTRHVLNYNERKFRL